MRSLRAITWWSAIALCAGFWGTLAAAWPGKPIPAPAPAAYRVSTGVVIVRLLPASEIAFACNTPKAAACTTAGLITMPDPAAVDPVTWQRLFLHELAHAQGGWPADHPAEAVQRADQPAAPSTVRASAAAAQWARLRNSTLAAP